MTPKMTTTAEKRPMLQDTCNSHSTRNRHRRLWRNAVVLNLCAAIGFCGAMALASIYSSLNSDQGLGVISLAFGSAFGLLGALLSGLVINLLGCKRSMVVAQLLGALSMSFCFYPAWATLLPGVAIGGSAVLILIVGHRVYTAQLGHLHSDVTDAGATVGVSVTDRTSMQGRFFLLYSASFMMGSMVGNLASSLILRSGVAPGTIPAPSLWSNDTTADHLQCGAAYCNEDLGSDFYDVTDRSHIYGFLGFCVGTAVLSALLMFFFLNDLNDLSQKMVVEAAPAATSPPASLVSVWKTCLRTLALHQNPRLLLIIPNAIVMIATDVFWTADFTKAFISCSIGMEFIGYVIMWNGVSGILSSFAFGWMSDRILRRGPMMLATLTQMALAISLLYWMPDQNSLFAFCGYTVAWAVCSGTRHSLLPALVGIVFRDKLELAFSNVLMWGAIGDIMLYLCSGYLCTDVKIYIIVALLVCAMIAYAALEVLLEMDRTRLHDDDRDSNRLLSPKN